LERRNFLVNFLLWILAFVFGYTLKTDNGTKVLQQVDWALGTEKKQKELVHRGIISDVNLMRKTNFKKGDYVKTLGYHIEGDGGHAEYIVKSSSLKDDGGSIISLNNGLQAHLIYNGLINVKWFGAKGNWNILSQKGTDDTGAVQKALNFAKTKKINVYFPSGSYGVKPLYYDDSSAGIIGDGKASTFIVAIERCNTLISIKNSVYIPIRDICFEGNNLAKTCLDTSFVRKDGPSVQNDYREVRIRNYTKVGWEADSNNDCKFDHILIESVKDTIGLHIPANGGMIIFNFAMFLSPLKMSCQNAVFNGCMLYGILIEGQDNNHIQMNGSYWYADPKTKNNLHLSEGAIAYSPALNGARMENGYNEGAFIGGTGRLYNGATFTSPHIFTTHKAKNQKLVSNTVKSIGPKGRIRIINGMVIGDVDTRSTENIEIIKETTQINGHYDTESEFQMLKTKDGISYSYMNGSEFGHNNNYGKISKYLGGTTPTITNNQQTTINKIPQAGIIIIKGTAKKAPMAVCVYSKMQEGKGVLTKLHEQKGAGGSQVNLTISTGSTFFLSVSHTHSRKNAFHYTVIGS